MLNTEKSLSNRMIKTNEYFFIITNVYVMFGRMLAIIM